MEEWNNNSRPCYIPNIKYNKSDCDNNNTTETTKININENKFVKPIKLGVFKNIIDSKYDIMDKSNKGFIYFCLVMFFGVCLPFFPSKFIYNKNEIYKSSWFKFIIISGLSVGLCVGLFILMKSAPSKEKLIEKENSEIEKFPK